MKSFTRWAATLMSLMFGLEKKSLRMGTIEAAILYLRAVRAARWASLGIFLMLLCLLFWAATILMLHALVLFVLPLERDTRLEWSAVLLLFDFACGLYLGYRLFSEKTWIKFSRADRWVDQITQEKNSG